MFNTTYFRGAALAVACALTFVACEAGKPSPTSPSAVVGLGGNDYADGSDLKVYPPNLAFPLNESTDINLIPTLIAQQAKGRFYTASTAHRFQVSTASDFSANLQQGMGEVDGQGVVRFAVNGTLATATKYYWRARAELEDAEGSWSSVFTFTTTGTAAAPPTSPTTPTTGSRTPNPAPGTRLPLPDMRGVLAQFSNASDSCPEGIKYIPNPWQNRVIDRFRQDDTRWGYNAKPTKTAADNGGRPVVAAGDEAAYNYSSDADEGTTQVHLVDMLVSHCGSPTIGWRVFTGEEPGRWTGAGRF
jgi:hypothetical protein